MIISFHFHLSVAMDHIHEWGILALLVLFFEDAIEQVLVRAFLLGRSGDQGQKYPIGSAVPAPDFLQDYVDSNIVSSLQFRNTALLNFIPIGCSEDLDEQVFGGLWLNQD